MNIITDLIKHIIDHPFKTAMAISLISSIVCDITGKKHPKPLINIKINTKGDQKEEEKVVDAKPAEKEINKK